MPALSNLIRTLEGPSIALDGAALRKLTTWATDSFDSRQGFERHDAPPSTLNPSTVDALISAAGPLGLLRTTSPAHRDYDLTVVLGGTVLGNRLRVDLTHRLTQTHDLGLIIGLAADRPLTASELVADPAGVSDRTEAAHLQRLLAERIPLKSPATAPLEADERTLRAPDRGGRRADTRTAVEHLITRLDERRRRSVLFVTSAIYSPYQFFLAAPLLLTASTRTVDLTGTETATDGDRQLLAQRIAQELNSAIHAGVTTAAIEDQT